MKNAGLPGLKEKSTISEICQNTLHYIFSKNIHQPDELGWAWEQNMKCTTSDDV